MFVQDGIYDKFVSKLKETVNKQLVLGDGMKAGVNQGPLINASQFKKVCSMVDDAVDRGAKVVMGRLRDWEQILFRITRTLFLLRRIQGRQRCSVLQAYNFD